MKYKWQITEHKNISEDFIQASLNSKIIATLLLNRGINTKEKVKAYLDPKNYKESPAEEVPDLIKAKDRILEAINKKEKITIFGDYDVDGVTSTSCLLLTLKQFTNNVDFYIPNRLKEGYGLNKNAVKKIARENKTNLLITCDCGTSNHEEIKLANSLGMDVIVTDHHSLPSELPCAFAVLNPKLLPENHKLHNLPGVGVAYKLCEAILASTCHSHEDGNPGTADTLCTEDLLDLVTLGMIADLASLVDENRYLVQIGLRELANTKKIGLQELLKMCSVYRSSKETENKETKVNTEHVGFGIAPRINAVGRLTDAALAVRLLTTSDLLEAVQIATELEFQNRERQLLCEETLKEAIEMIKENASSSKCILLAKEGWHHGVVGIVASRIVEKYNLPTILIALDKEQNIGKGSGRSINGFNITEALSENSSLLEKFGGHKAACGLSINPEKLEDFFLGFQDYANRSLSESDVEPILRIDMGLPLSIINTDLIRKIYSLSPFGLGNPVPLFASEEVEVVNIKPIGKNNQHLKLYLKEAEGQEAEIFEALIWNYESTFQLQAGDTIKIAYTPKLNYFNNRIFIQLEIKDWEVIRRERQEAEKQRSREEKRFVELLDYRERSHECLELLEGSPETAFFAEASQKDFLSLKTFSRHKINSCRVLVLLEAPPDENTFTELINKSSANKVYLAFSPALKFSSSPALLIRNLTGMLKFAVSNKGSKTTYLELEAALGINRTTLAYGLEVLVKIGLLSYKKITQDELHINISEPNRQNLTDLIEYNLFVSELKQINDFREKTTICDLTEIVRLLDKNKIKIEVKDKELAEIK